MKSILPLLSISLFFVSCTTAYKSGQTPDDVYFSPERPNDEYVRVEKKDNRQYQSEDENRDDRYIRLKIRDRRWSTVLEDDLYSYNSYYRHYNTYVSYNSPWNYYNYWNYYYNPYGYNNGIIVSPKTSYNSSTYNKPRNFNLYVFDGQSNTNNPNYSKGYKGANSTYSNSNNDNYRNSGSNAGGFLRDVFGSNNNSGSSSNNSSGSNNSSSGSKSTSPTSSNTSSGNAPVRKF